jgi:hypothetical protein
MPVDTLSAAMHKHNALILLNEFSKRLKEWSVGGGIIQ